MSKIAVSADVAIDAVASFAGSKAFLLTHALWFAGWLLLRLDVNTLTLVVSLEAIFLSTLILMSSKRQEAHDRAAAEVERSQVAEIDDLEREDKHVLRHLHELITEMHGVVVRSGGPTDG